VLTGLFQPMHLLLILAVVLIVFGAGKLPELGGALGKGRAAASSCPPSWARSAPRRWSTIRCGPGALGAHPLPPA
jgi:TatA/E family protein of Tat protein translocase